MTIGVQLRPGKTGQIECVDPPAAALEQAIQAHRAGEIERAQDLYAGLLESDPGHPDALHFLGVVLHEQGHSDAAVAHMEAALRRAPRHPDLHNNLGNVHKECGRLEQAEASYRRALACSSSHHQARANLAVVLEAQDRLEEAFVTWAKLLEEAPQNAHGFWMMGRFLRAHAEGKDHVEQAAACFRHALKRDDGHLAAWQDLGMTLYVLEQHEAARAVYRDWVARDPDNPVPRHMLAASGGAPVPTRAADDYVRDVFDRFASSFDEQLLQDLDYRAPQALTAALQAVLGPTALPMDILDAGCGTGLCGPLVRPFARTLVGVDLSRGMIDMARRRGDYDQLEVAELTGYLARREDAWDVIVSADTLVYFGDLSTVCTAAASALRAGGWLVFSLEASDGTEHVLSASGRYQHSRAHVEGVLDNAGFEQISLRADSLRKEAGRPVASWVVLARRPDTTGAAWIGENHA